MTKKTSTKTSIKIVITVSELKKGILSLFNKYRLKTIESVLSSLKKIHRLNFCPIEVGKILRAFKDEKKIVETLPGHYRLAPC